MFRIPQQNIERRPDSGYRLIANDDSAMDVLTEALQMGFGNDMTWMKNIKFDTYDSYEKYNSMVDALNRFQVDTKDVIAYSQMLKQEPLFAPHAEFERLTYIQSTSGELVSYMSHLLPTVKDMVPAEEYDRYQESLARLIWLRANITTTKTFPSRYSVDEWTELQKVISKFVDLTNDMVNRTPDGQYKGVNVEKKKVPIILTGLIRINQIAIGMGQVFETTVKAISVSVGNMMNACSGLMQWGDFKTNPIGTLVGVMNSLGSMYIAGGKFNVTLMELAEKGIQALGKTDGKKSLKNLKTMSTKDLAISAMGKVAGMITKMASGFFTMTTTIFSSAFSMFTTTLTSVSKILKSIAETSPVVEAISNYIGLFLSMLFLPFFTAFGEPLLNAMMTAITVLAELGAEFIGWLQQADETTLKDLNEVLANLVLDIEYIFDNFMNELVTNFDKLVPPMLDFIMQFTTTIINNSELILDLLETGIDAMNDMIEGNILATVMGMSTLVFDFIYDNIGFTKKCVNIMLDIIYKGLDFVSWCLSNLELATIAFCLATGTVCGAIGGSQVGMILAPFTLGASVLIGTIAGGLIGGGAGAVAAWAIINKWIKPAKDTVDGLLRDVPAYGSGGKIYGRRGGHVGLLGESGQGEYAIPQSKMDLFRGNNNIVLRFKKGVYNQKEIESVLKELKTEVQFDYIFE